MYSPDDLVALSGSGKPEDFLKVLQARAEVKQNYVRIEAQNIYMFFVLLICYYVCRHGLEILCYPFT